MSVTGLRAWCDLLTEDQYRQRLVRDGGVRKGPLIPGDLPVPSELPSWPGEAVEDLKQGISFEVHEFADLDDGRRLTLHEERGFTTSGQWRHLTLENLERDVRTTVLPDDDDTQGRTPLGVARRAPAVPWR